MQLGEILVEDNVISAEQLGQALEEQSRSGERLGSLLINAGLITDSDLARALAEQAGMEFINLTEFDVEPWVRTLVPESVSRRCGALPIGERNGKLLVAVSDPAAAYALDDIRVMTSREVEAVMATASDMERARSAV